MATIHPTIKKIADVLTELRQLLLGTATTEVPTSLRRELMAQMDGLYEELHRVALIPQSAVFGHHNYGIVGESDEIKNVLQFIGKAGPSDATVLIQGENGTGKEGTARALFLASKRSGAQFLIQNCGAVSDSLLETELFGHVKGAFTGALKDKKGYFELAHRGTLFLDEIGETSPAMQVKLLRVLQEGTFIPVGGDSEVKVDVRIVAATNRDLKLMVKEGKFREDLYYRLNVLQVKLPALRERVSDIRLLANHFLEKYAEDKKVARKRVSQECLEIFEGYRWPGNIRELQSQITRLCILSGEDTFLNASLISGDLLLRSPEDSHTADSSSLNWALGIDYLTDDFQRSVIVEALKRHKNNVTHTAQTLKVTPRGLRKMMQRLNIVSPHAQYLSEAS